VSASIPTSSTVLLIAIAYFYRIGAGLAYTSIEKATRATANSRKDEGFITLGPPIALNQAHCVLSNPIIVIFFYIHQRLVLFLNFDI